MIPSSNVDDLHVGNEVLQAVTEGRFHVWAVDTVEDSVAHLTGVPAGEWKEAEGWTADSVYSRCQKRLDEMVKLMRAAGKEEGEAAAGENKK